jgi:ribosomal protein S27AE
VMDQMNAEKPDDVLADLEAKHGSVQRLVSCPFCGGAAFIACHTRLKYHCGECRNCHAHGPIILGDIGDRAAMLKAASLWNARTANDKLSGATKNHEQT